MKQLYDVVSVDCSRITTRSYSTSFSLGILLLGRRLHRPIYSIYGFVRFADEIVDSFHDYDKAALLAEFKAETWKAIERGISMNPILNSFQDTVNSYHVDHMLIEQFFDSMEADLQQKVHSPESYSKYILGSAEVVGLMCLKVFTASEPHLYEELHAPAMKLGAAFQKVNFLRDLKADYQQLGRSYFPGIDLSTFSRREKELIQSEIEADFADALHGIKRLPLPARRGVYLAYFYYRKLFSLIKKTSAERIMTARIRIPNYQKLALMCQSVLRHQLNML